jgi:hypothetical protein
LARHPKMQNALETQALHFVISQVIPLELKFLPGIASGFLKPVLETPFSLSLLPPVSNKICLKIAAFFGMF